MREELFPVCDRVVRFNGTVLKKDAVDMEAGVVYKGFAHQVKVLDVVTKHQLTLNVYHTTTTPLERHAFSVAALRQIMDGFKMFDAKNMDVKLNLICVVDWSLKAVHGCKFAKKVGDQVSFLDIEGLRLSDPDVGSRLETYVARSRIYHTTEVALSDLGWDDWRVEESNHDMI